MAAKKPKPGSKDYGSVKFRGFVKVYLRSQDKAAVKAMVFDASKCVDFLEKLTDSGYKFSLSRSSDGKTATATAYCNDFRMDNAGLGVSMRHGDSLTAIRALAWLFAENGFDAVWDDIYGTDGDIDW